MKSNHLVGVNVRCWQLGDKLSCRIDTEDRDDLLWIVGGNVVIDTYKEPHAIESALKAATQMEIKTNFAGQTSDEYTVLTEVMAFDFVVVGTDHEYHKWGSLDFVMREHGLNETFGDHVDCNDLIRIARRHLEKDMDDHGHYMLMSVSFVTVWEYFAIPDHYENLDEEWYLIGELDMSRVVDLVIQKAGDKCKACDGLGKVRTPGLTFATFPPCPHCVGGRIGNASQHS